MTHFEKLSFYSGGNLLTFKMPGLSFSSKLGRGSYIISMKKIGVFIQSEKFFSSEVAFYLYKTTIQPCIEYCTHAWAVAPFCYLELLDKLQKQICRTAGPSFGASFKPLPHGRNISSLNLLYRYLILGFP